MKKWGARVLANAVLAPDVPPIPSQPPQSRRNLERDEPACGWRERMCVWLWWQGALLYGHIACVCFPRAASTHL